jgi:hypothetical protein
MCAFRWFKLCHGSTYWHCSEVNGLDTPSVTPVSLNMNIKYTQALENA